MVTSIRAFMIAEVFRNSRKSYRRCLHLSTFLLYYYYFWHFNSFYCRTDE